MSKKLLVAIGIASIVLLVVVDVMYNIDVQLFEDWSMIVRLGVRFW